MAARELAALMTFEWSKPVENKWRVQVRMSKCGRASIARLSKPGMTWNEYQPLLDGEFLPKHYRLKDAKAALEAAETGQALPEPDPPKWMHEYDYKAPKNPEAAEAAYKKATEWFRSRVRAGVGRRTNGKARNPYEILGLDETASLKSCKEAARNLILVYHPDRATGDRDKFEAVKAAIDEIKELNAA